MGARVDNQEYRDLQKYFDVEFRKVFEEFKLEEASEQNTNYVGGSTVLALIVAWYFLAWYYAFPICIAVGLFSQWVFELDLKEPVQKAADKFLSSALASESPSIEKTIALENWGKKIKFADPELVMHFQEQINARVALITKDSQSEANRVRKELSNVDKGGLAALSFAQVEETRKLPEQTEESSAQDTQKNQERPRKGKKTGEKATGLDGTPIPLGRLSGTITPTIPIYGNRAGITLGLRPNGLRMTINTVHMGVLSDEPRKYVYQIPYHCIASVERSDQIISSIVGAIFQPLTGNENRGYKITTHVPFNIYSRSSNNVTYWLSADVDGESNFARFEWLCKQPWPKLPVCPQCNEPTLEIADETGFFEGMSSDEITVTGTCNTCSKRFNFDFNSGLFQPCAAEH